MADKNGSEGNGVTGDQIEQVVGEVKADEAKNTGTYPEDEELKRLEQELAQAETGAKPAPEAPEAETKGDLPAATKQQESSTGTTTDTTAVPEKGKRDEIGGLREANRRERHRRQQAEIEAAEARGRAQALEEMLKARGTAASDKPQEQAKSPEELIADIDQEIDALAKQFDDGTITYTKLKQQERELENKKFEIRREQLKPEPVKVVAPEDLTLQERTAQLNVDYPILLELTADDLQPLVPLAYAQAKREGKPIRGGTPQGDLDLRTRVAKLATLHFGKGTAAPASTTQSPQPTTGAKPSLSATAQAREKAGERAAEHPPNVADLGRTGGAGEPTAAELLSKLDSMTEDERLEFERANPALFTKIMSA